MTIIFPNIILLGMPGSGKGTLSGMLTNNFNLKHVSQGDLLRKHLASNTAYANHTKEVINDLGYVPNLISSQIVFNELNKYSKGVLLDGFPRSLLQKKSLDDYLKESHLKIDFILYLQVSEKTVLTRIEERKRENDSVQGIQHRLEKFRTYTIPTIDEYSTENGFYTVNAEKTPDELYKQVLTIIQK